MLEISSLDNPLIKYIVKLHNSKTRNIEKKFILEGYKFISTALDANLKLDKIVLTKEQLSLESNLSLISRIKSDSVVIVTEKIMKKISTSVTPSGILSIFKQPEYKHLLDGYGVILDNISDPGNMGTLIRTAAACNIKNIIIINGVDVWSPKVVQSSAGTISFVNIYNWSIQDLLENKNNHKIYGLVPNAKESIFDLNNGEDNILMVIGNESNGISQDILNISDKLLKLPMPGNTESLNAGVAGSIAMYYLINKL